VSNSSSAIPGYEILEDLGKSTWGASYQARQVSLDRMVRLTVLPPEDKAPHIHKLARRSAALTHPHLISGIDMGVYPGGIYLVTEWVEGPSIGEIVRRGGSIAVERALEIALAAAQGLDHAAESGLGHGNITPESIIVARGGNPKLRGFGSDRKSTLSADDWRSPERKRGERVGVRSDIYSMGGILYYMLAGVHPFEDAPPPAVVDGVVMEEPVPLRELVRRIDPDVELLVKRMMAHSPDDRFSTAGEVAEDLEMVIEKLDEKVDLRRPKQARPSGRKTRPGRARRIRRRR
jgi:serine/threonine protein kinase